MKNTIRYIIVAIATLVGLYGRSDSYRVAGLSGLLIKEEKRFGASVKEQTIDKANISCNGLEYSSLPIFTDLQPPTKKGTVRVIFKNLVKNTPLSLTDSTYINPFGEEYTVTRFKYYISNVAVHNSTFKSVEKNGCHLIDESIPRSQRFSFAAASKRYTAISFMIGVDSLHNVSGAQEAALDPRNDMFWTWNSGYIMFKFEGNSPASTQVNNKIEYHIGGYAGSNKVLKTVTLYFTPDKPLNVRKGKTSEVIIEADIDKWWKDPNDIRIADKAVSMTPGPLAKKMADNYSKLFTVKQVLNN